MRIIKPEWVGRCCDSISSGWWCDGVEAAQGLLVGWVRRMTHYKKVHWWFYYIGLMAMKFWESGLEYHVRASLRLIDWRLERIAASIVTVVFRLIEEYLTRRSGARRHEKLVWGVPIGSRLDIVLVWYIVVHFEVGNVTAELRGDHLTYLTLFLLELSRLSILLLWIHRRSCISCLIKWSSCCDECFKEWIN